MSLKERLKKGLARLGKAVSVGVGATSKKDSVADAKKQQAKKERLRAGMLKATGQTLEQSRKISDRISANVAGTSDAAKRQIKRETERRIKAGKRKRAAEISRNQGDDRGDLVRRMMAKDKK